MTWSNVSWRASISARISSCRVRSRSAPLTSRTVFSDSISCSISLAQLSRSQACGEQLAHHHHLRYHRLHHLSSPALQIPQMWGTVGTSSSSTLSSPAPPLQSCSADPTDVGNSWHIIIIYIIITCTTSPVLLCRSHRCGEQLAHHHHLHYHYLHHLSSPALQIPQMLAWQIIITVILTVYIIMHSNRHTSMLEHCKLAVLSNVNFPAISLNPPPPNTHTHKPPHLNTKTTHWWGVQRDRDSHKH